MGIGTPRKLQQAVVAVVGLSLARGPLQAQSTVYNPAKAALRAFVRSIKNQFKNAPAVVRPEILSMRNKDTKITSNRS